ncbi:MAG: TetR/AcrR family transcriptional regulator [Caulobacter sp.]|nr:TetR/AcrR family transcriptional regulator [Caulobacter sp.]
MTPGQPRWRRRKDARPAEIVTAALEVFAERGFAAARLDDIAARAGVSKGALYLYFETKQELFEAVVRDTVLPDLDAVEQVATNLELPFRQLAPMLAARLALLLTTSSLPAVAKMVIAESRNFPDLARVWHDQVVSRALGVLTGVVKAAQARGEVRPGDPRFHALSIAGPMLMGVLWREVLEPVGAEPIDLPALAMQHVETALVGLLTPEARA